MTIKALTGTFIIMHIWANTMGLTVLFVLDNVITKCLNDRGYTNLPTTLSDKIRKFGKGALKFLIPYYYCFRSINLVTEKTSFESIVDDKIKNGEVIPFIRKPKEEAVIMEAPAIKIEPLPMTESYKAVPNGKSLYNGKRENTPKFVGDIITPDSSLISPFARKENIIKEEKEDELFEYLSQRSPEELSEIRKAINALEEAKASEIVDDFRLSLEDKNIA